MGAHRFATKVLGKVLGTFGFASLAMAAPIGVAAAAPAAPVPVVIGTTGSMADNGTYGNSLTFPSGGDLQLKVSGWQISQVTGAVTTAYVGAYSPGMGVTGIGDQSGTNGYHQIDNSGLYTDFVLLQFSKPVSLNSVELSSFVLGTATTKYNDFAIYALNAPAATWDAKIDLTNVALNTSKWKTLTNNGNDGTVPTGLNTLSSQWLIGAAFNSGNNDGFKIKSVNVTAVPEPATWASMILGMGAVGGVLRRRRRLAPVAVAG